MTPDEKALDSTKRSLIKRRKLTICAALDFNTVEPDPAGPAFSLTDRNASD
jgi:hypothetical protein